MIYKGYDNQEFLQQLNAVQIETGIQGTQGKYDRIKISQFNGFIRFLKSKKMNELAELFSFCFDIDRFAVHVANTAIIIENNKLVYKEGNLPDEFNNVQDFLATTGTLAGISLSLPLAGQAITVIVGLVSFINLLSNDAKDKATQSKAKMWDWRNSLAQTKGSMAIPRIATFAQAQGSSLFHQVPQCVFGTVTCQRDFFRYKFRVDFFHAAAKDIIDMVNTYWIDSGWKTFIDNYQEIVASIIPSQVTGKITGTTTGTQTQTTQEESSGIGTLVKAGIAFFVGKKLLGG